MVRMATVSEELMLRSKRLFEKENRQMSRSSPSFKGNGTAREAHSVPGIDFNE